MNRKGISSTPLPFFFSSRRRHTRSFGDWSSDVCSSDLYPLAPQGVRNQPFHPPGQPASPYKPRHREQSSDQEEKRLRAMAPAVSVYVDFILASPGLLRHQHLRRLLALSGRMSPELFVRSVERAHRYRITSLATLEQIARLQFQAGTDELPMPPIDESFRDRPAYQEGSLTDPPDLSRYE